MGDRKYTPIRGVSKEVSQQFEDESLDVVFIDATHTYPAVKQDIQLWLPKVKKGGILAGHDFEPAHPGVVKAVDELLPDREVMNYCWIYHKK
jgi:predicted O-methyltransferase YrrM